MSGATVADLVEWLKEALVDVDLNTYRNPYRAWWYAHQPPGFYTTRSSYADDFGDLIEAVEHRRPGAVEVLEQFHAGVLKARLLGTWQ